MGSGQSTDLEKLALQMLQNPSAPLVEMTKLAGALKSQRSFGYARRLFGRARMNAQGATPVSYTHLTLPTIYSV